VKIAILSSHTPSLFWFRMDMMKTFVLMGHDVVAIANEPADLWNDKFFIEGVRYNQINVNRNSKNPLGDLKTFLSIRKVLKAERPDKIFTYQAKTVVYGGIAARLLGIKEVYPLIAGLGSIFMSHGVKDKFIQKVLIAEYRISLKNSKKVFFQNPDDSEEFISRGIITKDKIVYISGSGVNTEIFHPTPLPEHPCFLYIGRLISDKGVQEYLEACRIVRAANSNKKIRCMLVGPYDTNPTALRREAIAPHIAIGVIEYYGEQPDVRPYLNQCSVFVLPSYREGTPKTVLEAMASGRAVITTDAPGCRETVQNGINGYLVPVKDSKALAEKMMELSDDFLKVSRMGRAGRELAEGKFDVRIVNKCIAETMGI
jgi:glycosyltransferase involved in cell wall biosynthesis